MMMMMVPTFAVTTAHTFVLTVSHGLLFRQPLLSATARLPPLLFHSPEVHHIGCAPHEISSQRSVRIFGLDSCSRRHHCRHHSGKPSFPQPFWPWRSILFAARQPRLPTRRTHETSRSEHDLNLAILYAVQSGFRYSASLLCLTCAADLLEPTIMEPTIMLRAFKATRHPHPRAIP